MDFFARLLRDCALGKKNLAVLIDPDKGDPQSWTALAQKASETGVGYLLVGGSLLTSGEVNSCILALREGCTLPIVLFPGSSAQISPLADAILLLSLISGRNAELLIGKHVEAAPVLARSGIEIWPTGYMLVESGGSTTASYMSQTAPLPAHKPEIAACTALAGEQLGLKLSYLDAGSGAKSAVPFHTIKAVKDATTTPLFVGGGIRDVEGVETAFQAGADVVVIGTLLEEKPHVLEQLSRVLERWEVALTNKD